MKKIFILMLMFVGTSLAQNVYGDWKVWPPGSTIYDIEKISTAGNKFFALTKKEILISDDGIDWKKNILPEDKMKLIFFITENIGWIISENGNVYRSIDGGDNFSLNSNTSPLINDIYFLTTQKGWLVSSDGRLYSTTDGGITWNTQVINTSANLRTLKFVNENIGFINHNYKTTDGGSTWFLVNQNNRIMLARYADENFGIGLSVDSIYKTTNGGVNWFSFKYFANGYWDFQAIAILDEQTFGISFRSDETYVAYGTYNGGNNFFLIALLYDSYFSNSGIRSIAIHPVQKNFIVGGFHGFIYHPYNKIRNQFNGNDLTQIFPEDENNVYAFALEGLADSSRIYYSSDKGINWQRIYSSNEFHKIRRVFPFENNWYAVRNEPNFMVSLWKSTDKGRNWFNLRTNDKFIVDLLFLDDDLGFMILSNHLSELKILRSIDGGINWQEIINSSDALRNINFVGDNGWISVGYDCGYYKTTDRGETWQLMNVHNCWNSYGITMYDKNYGFMVGDRFRYTEDSWETSTLIPFPSHPFAHGDLIVFDYRTKNEFYVAGGRRPGSNYGPPWGTILGNKFPLQQVSIMMPSRTVYNLIFLNEKIGWACGRNGTLLLFEREDVIPIELSSFTSTVEKDNVHLNWTTSTETNNKGFELQRMAHGAERTAQGINSAWEVISFIEGSGTTTEPQQYSFIDENVSSGKHKYKLIQIDFDGTRTEEKEIEVEVNFLPKEFALFQNYPNPFNPVTRIKYQVSANSFVILKVFDILGNEVTTLVNEVQEPGEYEIEFDGNNYSSGVYFYTLTAGDFAATKKFVLMK